MKLLKVGAVAGLALALAACPDTQQEVAVTDDPLLVDTPAVATEQPVAPPAGQEANLEAIAGSGVTGQVTAVPTENSTEIYVSVLGGPPNESLGVRVQSGTCENPGPELARIDAIGTDDMGQGSSRTDVGHAPHLIMDGNHIVAVYAPGTEPERDTPIACTTLPEHGAAGAAAGTPM